MVSCDLHIYIGKYKYTSTYVYAHVCISNYVVNFSNPFGNV